MSQTSITKNYVDSLALPDTPAVENIAKLLLVFKKLTLYLVKMDFARLIKNAAKMLV